MAQENPFAKYAPSGPLPSPPKVEGPKDPPSGYRWRADGGLEPVPGGPADPKSSPGGTEKPSQIPVALEQKIGKDVGTYVSLQTAANTFKDDYGGNPIGALENSAQSYFDVGTPGQREWWAAFKATDNQIRNDLFGAALTATEKAAYEATTISPGMRPEIIKQNVSRRRDIIRDALKRQREFAIKNGYRPEAVDALFSPILQEQQSLAATAENATEQPPAMEKTGGVSIENQAPSDPRDLGAVPGGAGSDTGTMATDTKTVTDPLLAGLADEYRKRLAASPSPEALADWLKSAGVTDTMTLAQAKAQARYRRRFPNVPLSEYRINVETQQPLSLIEKGISAVGQSADNPVGAGVVGAGNFVSGNNIDSLSEMFGGSAERTRAGLDNLAERYPKATTAGEMAGGVLASFGAESQLARAGVRGAPVVADMLIGAANGAGSADYGSDGQASTVIDRVFGAAKGAGAAYAGNRIGSKITRSLITPSGGNMADLYAAGVRPSIGQRLSNAGEGKGIKGMVGKTVNAAEEAFQSVPIVGTAIRGTRENARDQFQVGAFNESLKEIGLQLPKEMKPGTAPHAFAQAEFNKVYDTARSGMTVVADGDLAKDLAALVPDISTLGPSAQARLKSIMDNVVNNRVKGGVMDGEGYKKAVSGLGKRADRLLRSQSAEDQDLGDVLIGIQSALDSAARRHSPEEAVKLLDAADAGYAKLVRIEEAAKRRGGEAGTFSPAGFDSAVQKTSGGVRSKSYLRGDALMQDYAKAGRGLEDKLPNSGTADREMAGYAVGAPATGAALYADPSGITAAILGGALFANLPGVRKVVTGAMAPRGGAKTKKIADMLARIAGSAAATTAVQALPGTSPVP
jgi:hypothetical protein